MNGDQTTAQNDLQTPEEAAIEIFDALTAGGYSLADKAAISKQVRKLVRTEAENQQKELSTLIDSL
jgi:hypothetical protein